MSRPTWSVTRSTSSLARSSGVKWSPAVGAAAEPSSLCVDGLVALRVGERLGDVRRERRLTRRLALQPQAPAALAQVLDQLDRPQPLPGPQLLRRPRKRFPLPGSVQRLEEENLGLAAGRPRQSQPRRHDTRVVDHDQLPAQLLRQLTEPAVADVAATAVVHQQPRLVATLGGVLRDQLLGQRVLELGSLHPRRTLAFPRMDEAAMARAKVRLEQAAEGRNAQGNVDAALERARAQVEALAELAAQLETTIPGRVEDAVREGVRTEAAPVGRQLAEVRGLAGQTIRRLEGLENDLLAERHARVDDLALLVDLISSGWNGVDQRLARMEKKLETDGRAELYRIDERKAG